MVCPGAELAGEELLTPVSGPRHPRLAGSMTGRRVRQRWKGVGGKGGGRGRRGKGGWTGWMARRGRRA